MTRRPRTVHTVTNDLNHDQRMQRICASLARAGFEPLLVGRELSGSAALGEQPFSQKRLTCLFHKGPLFYLEFNVRLFFFLLKTDFELLNTIDLDTMPGGCLAALIKGKKRVFDAHEFFTEVPEVYNRRIVKKMWQLVGWLFVRFYHSCYTVGDCLAEIFTKIHGKKFETIRNVPPKAYNQKPTTNNQSTSQPIILYQGALNKGRGIEAAIMAMKEVDFAELWLAGEGDLSENLRRLATENGLGDRVKFLGMLRPDELRAITKQAWLGLNLLEMNGLSYYYSLANKFFDYIQAGVPSLNPAFPEYQKICAAHEVGLLLDRCEPGAVAKAVFRLKNDPALYRRLVENCAVASEIFNWDTEEIKLIEIYQKLEHG